MSAEVVDIAMLGLGGGLSLVFRIRLIEFSAFITVMMLTKQVAKESVLSFLNPMYGLNNCPLDLLLLLLPKV